MIKHRISILFLSTACLAFMLSCAGRREENNPGTRLTAEAVRGPMEITVRGSGEIRSRNSNRIIPQIRRSSVISFLVPDGSSVEKDDVIIRFNTEEFERRVSEAESRIEENQSKLNTAETDLEIQVMDNDTSLKKANLDLSKAEMELEKFLSGDKPLELRNADLKIRNAESDLLRKKTRLEDLRSLVEEGFVTQDEVDEQSMAVDTARVSLDTAKIEKNLLETYTLPLREQTFRAAVESAKTELDKTMKQNAARFENRRHAVEAAKQALARSRDDLRSAENELAACEVKAPVSGIVMYGNPDQRRWRVEVAVGATIHRGQVIMGIPDMTDLEVVVNVHEADIHRVKQGQRARITVDAVDRRVFEGKVTHVAQVASSDGWMSSDVKEFEVRLAISNYPSLRPGFSCDAEIITEQLDSALYFPVAAIFREEDEHFFYPVSGGGREKQVLEIGRSSLQHVQIISGAEEGDKAFLLPAPGSQ